MESQIQWDNILVKSNIYPNKGKYRVWNSSFIQIKSRLYSAFVWNVCLEIVGKNLGSWIKPKWNPEFIWIFARHLSIAMNHRSFFLKKIQMESDTFLAVTPFAVSFPQFCCSSEKGPDYSSLWRTLPRRREASCVPLTFRSVAVDL